MGALRYVWMIWGRVRRQQRTFPRGSRWHFRAWVGVLGSEKSSGDSSENVHLEHCLPFVCLFFNPCLGTCLLIFFLERREKEREIGCLLHTPCPGLEPETKVCTWLGIKPTTYWSTWWCSNQLSHTAKAEVCLYFGSEFWLISNCCFPEFHEY